MTQPSALRVQACKPGSIAAGSAVSFSPDATPSAAVAADDRPFDFTPIATAELPATPTRDRNIAAAAWQQAPEALLQLGKPLGIEAAATAYKRRIGDWLLWRAGPARGPAVYLAIHSADLTKQHVFELSFTGEHRGVGPSGIVHTRFRAWKEDLLGRT